MRRGDRAWRESRKPSPNCCGALRAAPESDIPCQSVSMPIRGRLIQNIAATEDMQKGTSEMSMDRNGSRVAGFLANVWTGLKPQLGHNKAVARYVLCLLGTIMEDIASGEGRFAGLDPAAKSRLAERAMIEAENMLVGLTGVEPYFAKALAAVDNGKAHRLAA